MADKMKFKDICRMFTSLKTSKAKKETKQEKLAIFWREAARQNYPREEFFEALRLFVPEIDRERLYRMKHAMLSETLGEALGVSKFGAAYHNIKDYKGGEGTSHNVGKYLEVAMQEIRTRAKDESKGMTVRDVNRLLDDLKECSSKLDRFTVFKRMLDDMDFEEMEWFLAIVLKELKIGLGCDKILDTFHENAKGSYNMCIDLREVCKQLCKDDAGFVHRAIEVGYPVRPQLAKRVNAPRVAWNKFSMQGKVDGKSAVVEAKMDGERIQAHKDGDNIQFFTRVGTDYSEKYVSLIQDLREHVTLRRCILDGEMVVRNRETGEFQPFGTSMTLSGLLRDGRETSDEFCYMVFDVIFAEEPVVSRPLFERQEILREGVKPMDGRIVPMLPGKCPCSCCTGEGPAETCVYGMSFSEPLTTEAGLEDYHNSIVSNRMEGVVIKDLRSPWKAGDRSDNWQKLKPDYLDAGTDLDMLVMGGMYGSGRRGGQLSQFLLGISVWARRPGTRPTEFHTCCRVGTGMSDEQLDKLNAHLKPHAIPGGRNRPPPTSAQLGGITYGVKGDAKETPDVWFRPEQSVILNLNADLRAIDSKTFKSPVSLRFPRVANVRWDKPWFDCLTLDELLDSLVRAAEQASGAQRKSAARAFQRLRRGFTSRDADGNKMSKKRRVALLLRAPDTRHVAQKSSVLEGRTFYLAQAKDDAQKRSVAETVKRHGGENVMGCDKEGIIILAHEEKGIQYTTQKKKGRDIFCVQSLFDAVDEPQLLERPRASHFMFMSSKTHAARAGEEDAFGDSFEEPVTELHVKRILANVPAPKSFSPAELASVKLELNTRQWPFDLFLGTRARWVVPDAQLDNSLRPLARAVMMRLEVEAAFRGMEVTTQVDTATSHVVVFSPPGAPMTDAAACTSLTLPERRLVEDHRHVIHLVSHDWVEQCLANQARVPEWKYLITAAQVAYGGGSPLVHRSCTNKRKAECQDPYEEPCVKIETFDL
eukprot:jgi/Mesvir1/13536/Mv26189-RA.1